MKTIEIKEETRIPGTDLVLEANDKIMFKESLESEVDSILARLKKIDEYGFATITAPEEKALKEFIADWSYNRGVYSPSTDRMILIGKTGVLSIEIDKNLYDSSSLLPGFSLFFRDLAGKGLGEEKAVVYYKKVLSLIKNLKKLDEFVSSPVLVNNTKKLFNLRDEYLASRVIGAWVEKCVAAGSPQKFYKRMISSYAGEQWIKDIINAVKKGSVEGLYGDRTRLDPDEVLNKEQDILDKFCDPIETFVFGKPVSSAYEG